LACLALAATLERDGFEPVIFNQSCEDGVEAFLARNMGNALFAGISAFTGSQIKSGLDIARRIRARSSTIPLVWGGRHPTALPRQTIEDPLVDIVVRGEVPAAIRRSIELWTGCVAGAQVNTVSAQRLADSKSFNKYAFARTLDSTERIAAVLQGTHDNYAIDLFATLIRVIADLVLGRASPVWIH